MRTVPATSNALLFLGKKGENLATQVIFPFVKEWAELYGEGTFQLIYQRYGDNAPYAVALSTDEENVMWPVTNTDTDKVGSGKCELQYYVTDENENQILAKSVTFITKVVESLDNAGETPPEPWESWIEQILEAGSDAEQSAIDAAESAQEASGYADNASGSASDAEGYAEAARLSAVDSAESANQASGSAQTAAGYADSASEDAGRASEYADNASTYKDKAKEYADDASDYASNASN